MKKNRLWIVSMLIVLVIGCSGCGAQIPDMSDSQREAISAYAVELLLKYDTNKTSRLVDPDTLEKEPEQTAKPVVTEPPKGMDETEDTVTIDLNGKPENDPDALRNVLGLSESISLTFKEARFEEKCTDSLSEDLVIEASGGKSLFVCEFVLVNDGAEKQSVDMLRKNIQYQLVADRKTANCMVTMLANDLTTYMGVLESDESEKVVVITEIEKDKLNNVSELYLLMESEDGKGIIQIR